MFFCLRQKSRKSQKNQPQASKIAPKWSQNEAPGLAFSIFWKPCFRTTLQWFCLFLQVQGGPGATKNRLKNAPKKKNLKNTRFLAKSSEKCLKRDSTFGVFWLLFRAFCALGAQGCPKAPRDCPGTPKVLKKVSKRSPKGTKTEPKVLENATKITKRNSR